MHTSGIDLLQPARTAGPILAGLRLRLGLHGAPPPAVPNPKGIKQSTHIGRRRGCDFAHQCYYFDISSAIPPRPPLPHYPSNFPISPPIVTPHVTFNPRGPKRKPGMCIQAVPSVPHCTPFHSLCPLYPMCPLYPVYQLSLCAICILRTPCALPALCAPLCPLCPP